MKIVLFLTRLYFTLCIEIWRLLRMLISADEEMYY